MSGAVLALDLGATLGFALRRPGGAISSGEVELHTGARHGYGVRFLEFRRWLATMERDAGADAEAGYERIDRVFYEEVNRHVSTDSAHAYGGFLATLASWCELRELPYKGIGVGVWKKRIIGRGDADKDQVLAEMQRRGFKPRGYNEADALALLAHALGYPAATIVPPSPKRKPKRAPKAAKGSGELAHALGRLLPPQSAELPLGEDKPF